MVRTMSLLQVLISTARGVRHAPQLADELPPDHAVLLDAPDDRLAPALVAAALGDHEPAAKLLATTRGAAEWESRDRYVTRLAAFAQGREEWLAGWLEETPHDPDALLVKAEVAVRRAWESPARAERLRDVGPLIDAAADASPRDPVPWRLALDHARGTGAGHPAFEALWEQAVRRAAHHHGCHVAALKYLSAQRRGAHGSYRECFDFAEQAADDARPGSLIRALPVRAAYAQLRAGDTGSVREDRIDAAADQAIELSGRYAVADPWPAEMRNVLAYVLTGRSRWAAALDQFRLIGPYATSFPWSSVSDDPLGRFLDARDGVRLEVASAVPSRGRAGRGRFGGHYA
ncbi:hypothetical protein [Streptomyces ficellus]|uniref:DUF4034 domain-containing protein n=1 Tax=Streptomyces ficellus TaxID=1977088 RepID=A0A6I6FP51_9ACTN|nr:hypothetical protein [Streptomyces ficellus]QGV81109.1 hypothetical protein EIZ62_24845 [Streptomyces ficellus]